MAVSVGLVLLMVVPAVAHGPCRCLSPSSGPPGQLVEVPRSYDAIEVLWNPDPRDLHITALVGTKWHRLYRANERTLSLARRAQPGALRFRVPKAPPGRYLVVIFDPSEGRPREHFTWASFDVSSPLPLTGDQAGAWLLSGAGFLIAGLALAAASKLHRARSNGHVPGQGA